MYIFDLETQLSTLQLNVQRLDRIVYKLVTTCKQFPSLRSANYAGILRTEDEVMMLNDLVRAHEKSTPPPPSPSFP